MVCYLGLGSNLGDRKEYINKAITHLVTHPQIQTLKCSSIIETKAFGLEDQPDFLNCVLKIKTNLKPHELLKYCLKTELNMGRIRHEKWGPRIIDIDMLFYSNEIIEEEDLTIPHPGIAHREFVLRSLIELCPEFNHPKLDKKIKILYNEVEKN